MWYWKIDNIKYVESVYVESSEYVFVKLKRGSVNLIVVEYDVE